MRATEIFVLLKNAGCPLVVDHFVDSSERVIYTSNIRRILAPLSEVPGYEDIFRSISEEPFYYDPREQINLNHNQMIHIHSKVLAFINSINGLFIYLQSISTSEEVDSLFIRLPDSEDLEQVSNDLKRFNKTLSQLVLHEQIGGSVKLKGWEKGSLWFEIFMGASSAVSLVGSLAWSGAVVWKKIQEGRIFAEHVKSLKIKNDSMSDLQDAQKKMLDSLVDAEANYISGQDYCGVKDPEYIERLKFGIREISDLIGRGAEIHPSLNAPETVKNLFPDVKNPASLESRIKQIEGE